MEKRTVKFYSEGVRLEGDLYLPSGLKAGERRPGVVLCHGFTGAARVDSRRLRASLSPRPVSSHPDLRLPWSYGGSEGIRSGV